mmetsp:Transcript_328/g.790  ORF Transcript_328/g.790 Transcript_328/m.790 type:complete len:261 (+) Transcript_328:1248-2030(+)
MEQGAVHVGVFHRHLPLLQCHLLPRQIVFLGRVVGVVKDELLPLVVAIVAIFLRHIGFPILLDVGHLYLQLFVILDSPRVAPPLAIGVGITDHANASIGARGGWIEKAQIGMDETTLLSNDHLSQHGEGALRIVSVRVGRREEVGQKASPSAPSCRCGRCPRRWFGRATSSRRLRLRAAGTRGWLRSRWTAQTVAIGTIFIRFRKIHHTSSRLLLLMQLSVLPAINEPISHARPHRPAKRNAPPGLRGVGAAQSPKAGHR